jgi:tetratricopeptide (TPR) repeat protein
MRPSILTLALGTTAAVVLLALPPSLRSQNAPKRPPLDVGADTNSAVAYYFRGARWIHIQPGRAADAFYWAAQLDPTWAQPLYARRVALIMASNDLFVIGYIEGVRSITHSKQAVRIDSLELHARMLNPFLNRELDEALLMRYVRAMYNEAQRAARGRVDATETSESEFFAQQYLRNEAPYRLRALVAASERRFSAALDLYRQALDQDQRSAGNIHMARAQIFNLIGIPDSARAEMQLAIDRLRAEDAKDFVYFYESKGVLEDGIGMLYEAQAQIDQAREAYGRALQEDLSYYPAHLRLGLMALATGDTAAALNEMDLAAQIKEDEPWVQLTYGSALADAGRLADADQHLRRAAELAPFYAIPYYALGRVAEDGGKRAEAIQHYRDFLARAPAQDARVTEVRQRLTRLGATEGGPPE